MRIDERIAARHRDLSPQERRAAATLLEHLDDLATYRAAELATLAGVSKATMSRLFRSLGYADFGEVREQLRETRKGGEPRPTPGSPSPRPDLDRPLSGGRMPDDHDLDRHHLDQHWLAKAVELATANVADDGGPFGAVIVRDGVLLSTGQNRVTRDLDPTAHAEVLAIRAACTSLGDFTLTGCVLYASCEPCPMCICSALWARVDRVVYAASRDDAARGGFDDSVFYDLFTRDRETWSTPVDPVALDGSFAPFQAWLEHESRTHY